MFTFKFIEKRNLWFFVSLLLFFVAFFVACSRFVQSKPLLNYGIDFLGGHAMILRFSDFTASVEKAPDQRRQLSRVFLNSLREALFDYGIDKVSLRLSRDHDVLLKTLYMKSQHAPLMEHLGQVFGAVDVLEIDYIGPSIGEQLKKVSIWITLLVALFLLLYISLRFEFSYGLAALTALLHDALVIFSFAAIFNLEINTIFIAAFLTVLGYSINDTIVVFDRVRENREAELGLTNVKLLNLSLNQTLLRTINTSVTTFLVILSLIIFGGVTITQFSIILLIGIFCGTYSSLCIASPVLFLYLRRGKKSS
ncbi:MAG: protein translocase subunit SecF [bacterium]